MKNPTNNKLSCSVFGHNFDPIAKDSQMMKCKNCELEMSVEQQNAIETLSFKNPEIQATLQKLYLLQLRFNKRQLSI